MTEGAMRYGVVLPGGTAPQQLEQAVLAERAGWDGVFVWETARCDGIIPEFRGDDGGPDGLRALRTWLAGHGAHPDLDVVTDGESPADDVAAAAAQVGALAEAGATWWLETRWGMPDTLPERVHEMTGRLAAGPPGRAGGGDQGRPGGSS
jgi:hypothetical protein